MHTALTSRRPDIPFVDLTAQYTGIADEIDEAIDRILRTSEFILGRDVEGFEQEFARYCECEYGVGVDSGASALELALRAYGVGPGDEVIVPANTFIATALAVSCTGATPVLVDIDPATHTIDVTRLDGAITSRTKAILPVHLYGQPADMDPILDIAGRQGLVVIEDACQAHGARYKGRRVGSLGDIAAAFSFYPSKNLGACGDGGMVVTSDMDAAKSLQLLRNYGQTRGTTIKRAGTDRRLDNLQAAVLRIKLKYLDTWNNARRDLAEAYGRLLGDVVLVPVPATYSEPVWHLYVIQMNGTDRDGLQAHLGEQGIATGIHYPIPIHLQPAYRHLGYQSGSFPITERVTDSILSLPMYTELPLNRVEEVADSVRAFVTTRPSLETAV